MPEGSFNSEIPSPESIHTNTKNNEINSIPKEITVEQRQKLETLRDFFKIDDKIKGLVKSSSPSTPNEIDYNDSSIYADKLFSKLNQMKLPFEDLAEKMDILGLPGKSILDKSQEISEETKKTILEESRGDFYKLAEIYRKKFSQMNPELSTEISGKIKGYYLYKVFDYSDILNKTESFNDLLHLAHACVLNDENLFSQLPLLDSTKKEGDNNDSYGYSAYGEKNENATKIFDYLKEQLQANNLSEEKIEIPSLLQLLSVDNSIQLMVRDFGHALSIRIDISKPHSAYIEYNVPKIFDGIKANQLPGVEKIKPAAQGEFLADTGVKGRFESSYEDLAKNIFDFILKVPTDTNH